MEKERHLQHKERAELHREILQKKAGFMVVKKKKIKVGGKSSKGR